MAKATSGSSRSAGEALSAALPSCLTASRTTALSARSSADAASGLGRFAEAQEGRPRGPRGAP
eukprot:CAMPEP_0180662434 /NCGR_PEP_ID=MMETSP1037_2-20121125/59391_1 /TAXON_ID=632150 /ORGANISM="Azadinium spinosum, Strain 3D9" /LENGTH=62 /DNA_ID=CAMNT_0022690099 /DNA_START=106 /DNA_END=292 /DNA_ORIENTATION=-